MPAQKKNSQYKDDALTADSYRILDANINRAKEGLRVCEDIARFHLKNTATTSNLSLLRHQLTRIINRSALERKLLFKHRNSSEDLGSKFVLGLPKRSFKEIFLANCQRAKEALRVIEEFLKLFDITASQKTQDLRFSFYELEKKTIKRFPALLDPR
jgi:thiamine-phosphate pyrophosphorylase